MQGAFAAWRGCPAHHVAFHAPLHCFLSPQVRCDSEVMAFDASGQEGTDGGLALPLLLLDLLEVKLAPTAAGEDWEPGDTPSAGAEGGIRKVGTNP